MKILIMTDDDGVVNVYVKGGPSDIEVLSFEHVDKHTPPDYERAMLDQGDGGPLAEVVVCKHSVWDFASHQADLISLFS